MHSDHSFYYKGWLRTCSRKACIRCSSGRLRVSGCLLKPAMRGTWETRGSAAGSGRWLAAESVSLGYRPTSVQSYFCTVLLLMNLECRKWNLSLFEHKMSHFISHPGDSGGLCPGLHTIHSYLFLCELQLLHEHDHAGVVQRVCKVVYNAQRGRSKRGPQCPLVTDQIMHRFSKTRINKHVSLFQYLGTGALALLLPKKPTKMRVKPWSLFSLPFYRNTLYCIMCLHV